jgi:hypothetical protein
MYADIAFVAVVGGLLQTVAHVHTVNPSGARVWCGCRFPTSFWSLLLKKINRKRQNNAVFFHNDIEIDSDYKNKDLYKDKGIEDVRVILTKLSNGEVYVIEKKILNGDEKQLGDFVDSDLTSFYLLDIVAQCGDFSFAEKVSENNKTVYTFGLTNNGTATLLTWLNTSLDLDPLARASVEALVYGQFIDSSM